MAINSIRFAADPNASTGVPNYGDLVSNLLAGYKAGNYPREQAQTMEKERGEMLKTALANELTGKYGAKKEEANLAHVLAQTGYLGAQTSHTNALTNQANDPSSHLSGLTAEIYGLHKLEQKHGANDPIVEMVKKGLQNKIKQMEVLNDYRTTLSGTATKRASTPIGKIELEIRSIQNDPYLSEEEKQAKLTRSILAREKLVSDTGTRQKVAFATNIDKTLQSFDPKDLIQYSGPRGQLSLKLDQAKAANGSASSQYKNYEKAATSAKLLGKQIRQFYGDSIQPAVLEDISLLVNPSTWMNNPDIALSKFNQLKNVLLSETETYKEMSPGLIRNKENNRATNDPLGIR